MEESEAEMSALRLRRGVETAQRRLSTVACPDQTALLARFFKTAPGQYGERKRRAYLDGALRRTKQV
jgi:hypothetical protein